MYTAPRFAGEPALDKRFPIGVAPWHLHINFCIAPTAHRRGQDLRLDPRFGAFGTIATEAECAAAGGEFKPVVYGWMTHVDLYDANDKD
jgi:hypothetical protein